MLRPPPLRSSRGNDGLGHLALAITLFLVWAALVITIVSLVVNGEGSH